MKREDVLSSIERCGIVPIVRTASRELASRAIDAVLLGGVPVVEVTMTVPDALGLIRALCDRYAGRAVIGAGTVLDAAQAEACIDAGATFLVSPGFDLATVQAARRRDVAVVPGALTPTEVMTAWKAGADLVKIFPCSAVGGAKYLRTIKAPLPAVKLLPTGGVTLDTLPEYLAAGASAVGIGADLIDVAALEAGQDARITERARTFMQAVARARGASDPQGS